MNEPIWIELRDVLAVHRQLVSLEGDNAPLRDWGLLRSAIVCPRQIYAYGERPSKAALAVAYAAGIINNHSFIEGSKRTAFVAGILFLKLNGYSFDASEDLPHR